jgi:enoyl-[acyl-carrier protein] reductase II
MNADAEWLRGQIRAARQATDRPFGVNIMLMSPFADEVAQVVVDERVPVVITGAGNPTKYMKAWEAAGVKVVPVVASVALARLVERVGATADRGRGRRERRARGRPHHDGPRPAGGRRREDPVVAAGGIADGRQVAAALMLGAQGVQVGTRFLVAEECTVSDEYKRRILKAKRHLDRRDRAGATAIPSARSRRPSRAATPGSRPRPRATTSCTASPRERCARLPRRATPSMATSWPARSPAWSMPSSPPPT